MDEFFYQKIKSLRNIKGYSQSLVAGRLGISQRAYSKIELGQTKLKWDYLKRIANILEVSVFELINDNKDLKQTKTNIELLEELITQYETEINELRNEIQTLKQD